MLWRTLACIILVASSPGVLCAGAPSRFVVIGDTRTDGSGGDVITPAPMYRRAIDEINLLQPDFVVILGDLVLGYTELETLEKQWDAFDRETSRLQAPVHLVVGNHDVWNRASEQVYARRYGDRWYSFDAGECHFVVLDSEDQAAPQQIAGAQLEWLKSDLAASAGKRVFVFVHQPLWAEASYPRSGWMKDVHPLLAAAGVDTVFAGHWHNYENMGRKDGVRYIVTGGGGAEIGGVPAAGDFYHYLWVTADGPWGTAARLAVIRTGHIEAEDVVTTELRDAWGRLRSQLDFGPVAVSGDVARVARTLPVHNPFPRPMAVSMEFADAPGWTAVPKAARVSVPGGGDGAISVEVSVDATAASGALPYRVRFEVEGRGSLEVQHSVRVRRVIDCPKKEGVEVDGSLREWTGEPALRLDRQSQVALQARLWGGPSMCSGMGWVGYDDANLYLALRVTDPSLEPRREGGPAATADSVELYLDGRPEGRLGRPGYSAGVTYLIITPGLAGEPARVAYQEKRFTELRGVTVASRLTAEGYDIEVAVPLSNFPQHGNLMGLDVALNDNSNPAGRVQLVWNGTMDDWQDASAFGLIRLAEP